MQAPSTRHLDWDGCFSVRDLGNLPTGEGRRTRWGALVGGDSLAPSRVADDGHTRQSGVR